MRARTRASHHLALPAEDPRERVGPGLPAEWQRAKANGPVPPRPRAVLSTPFNRAAD